jgi:hypothetical protein
MTTDAAAQGRLGRLLVWQRPRSWWDAAGVHLPLALAAGLPVLLPFVTSPDRLPLRACTMLQLTGIPCPFCGFTRAFWAMAAGEWGRVLSNCPLAMPLYLGLAAIFIWNTSALLAGVRLGRGRLLTLPGVRPGFLIAGLLLLLGLNWLFRLGQGLV